MQRCLLNEYLVPEGIDAVVGLNDLSSLALLQALHDSGIRCPEDIKIVGYDNEYLSQYSIPPLTTVDENCPLQARMIVDSLLKKINHPEEEMKGCFMTVIPQLIVRESTKNR